MTNSRYMIQPSVLDQQAFASRLFTYGQLVNVFGLNALKDQLKDEMLTDNWLRDLRGFNVKTIENGINHLHELPNPNYPPTSAGFRKICLNHMDGFVDFDSSLDLAMAGKWDDDGILYAMVTRCGGGFWLERATVESISIRWKRAYIAVRDEWLDGMRWNVPSQLIAIGKPLQPEKTNSPFIRRENENIMDMMNRYMAMAGAYKGDLPDTGSMLMKLVQDNYLESKMLNDWRMMLGGQHNRAGFELTVKISYVAAYHSPVNETTIEGV